MASTKFVCTHTLPPGQLTTDQMNQFAQAAQHDKQVRGYRSFANLTEGKVVCVMEADSAQTLQAWFKKMEIPVDSITPVEFEGDRGDVQPA